MNVRTAFLGAAVFVALAVVSVVQASPGDAHDRQAFVAVVQDSHDRAVLPGSKVATAARDAHDRQPVPQPPTAVVASQNGFDWGDAALGAASGIGLVVLVAGLVFLVVSPRAGTRVATR
jgi:hypothetical protein